MLLVYIPFDLISALQHDNLNPSVTLLGHVIVHIQQGYVPANAAKTIAEIIILIRALEVLFLNITDVIILPLVAEYLQLIDLTAFIRRTLHDLRRWDLYHKV